jgi:superfamily II DNA or RNA helicase
VSATTLSETPIALRPYQRDALTAIEAAELRGVRRQVLSLPTGAGKTVIFSHLLVERQARALVLVHRDELVTQTLDKLAMVARGTALDIGVVKAERDEHAGDIVVASVQTLGREKRLRTLAQTYGLIVVDECHHAMPENGYGRILSSLGAFADDGPLTVGCTATPFRPDNSPIITAGDTPGCFDEVVYTLPLPWMIQHGYLAPIVGKELVLAGFDLDAVRTRHGDYVESDLGAALMGAHAPQHIVRGFCELAMGRRAIVFCPTVGIVNAVQTRFIQEGLRAASVVGATPLAERHAIYAQLRAGTLDALVSCMVLTEGFDEPSVDCVILARPTKSKVLFFQAIGRGLRLSPLTGKQDCLLIDAACASKRHSLLSLAAQMGLLAHVADGQLQEEREASGSEQQDREEAEGSYRVRTLDLTACEPLHWVQTPKGYWVVSLADRTLRVRSDGAGTYLLEANARGEKRYQRLADGLSLDYCFGIASDTAKDAKILHLVKEGAQWRLKARSDKQEALARKLGIRMHPEWRSGDLADAITAVTGDWYD